MTGAHPLTDRRRAAALRTYLRRLAASLTPRWAPTGERDDFGSALLEIAARLGEETTRRLDGTAQRDAIAFFEFLGLPPTPPRAATGALVMALAKGNALPVFAPARTQVVVSSQATGKDVTFETKDELRVVPGRIAELIAVDPATDRIELAPAQVTSLEPRAAGPGSYQVASFAGPGSLSLQVSPAVGLAKEDLLRVGTSAHRIAEFDNRNGLVTLHDPLEAPAAADATVTRIGSLESFKLRDLQRHALYIGHEELFDLEQPAEISLVLAPSGLARELTRLDIAYAMYGTNEGDSEPDWHPLDLLGTSGATIRLAKPGVGSVDKVEVHGRKNRWLRALFRGPVNRRPSLTASADQVCLKVASMDASASGTSAASAAGGGSTPDPAEGSRTIARAVHNGTPLSTAGRFYPFGPEPLRFDVFALAAPEALSKKGAEVEVTVTMVDSSLAAFEITAAGGPTLRGYGVGRNGDLQALSFTGAGGLRWHVLESVDAEGRRLLLSNAASVGVTDADLVVIRDRDGGLWSARIRSTGEQAVPSVENGSWRSLPALASSSDQSATTPNGGPPGPVLAPAPPGVAGVTAVLLGVAEGALHALKLDDNGQANAAEWQPVRSSSSSDQSPVLTGAWQVTPVQGPAWPGRPEGPGLEIVVIDDQGAVWLGSTGTIDATQPLTLTWRRFDGTGEGARNRASADVRPAATRFRPGQGPAHLWIAYARPGDSPGNDRILHGLVDDGLGNPEHVPVGDHTAALVAPGTALHANPNQAVLGVDRRPVTAGLGPGSGEAVVWLGAGELTTTPPIPGAASNGRPILLQAATDQLELVLGGNDERLFRATVGRPLAVGYELHDLLELESGVVAHRVEIAADPNDPATSTIVDLAGSGRIKQGNLRLYQLDQPPLVVDATLRYLRHAEPTGPSYTAAFDDPANRAEVRLDAADHVTAREMRLIIGDASYEVTAVSAGRVATLAHPVLGGDASPSYRPARLLDDGRVQPSQIRTLAKLLTSRVVGPGLRFGLGTSPSPQRLRLQQRTSGSVWARLDEAWVMAPPARGWAAVPGSYEPPVWTVSLLERGYQNPELSWEYFDGKGWRRLETGFLDGTGNLSSSGQISFVVPDDLGTTEIGGEDDYWIRARLVGGDYGRPNYVVRRETSTTNPKVEVQTVTVDTSDLRPPEILAIEATFTLNQQIAPEAVLVENNLDVLDQTQAAAAPAARFELFQGARAIDADTADRALYVGLTGPISSGSLVLLVDAADQDGAGPLQVDLRTTDGWRRAIVDDRTESLRRRGMLTVSLDADPVMVRLFGQARVWLRLRPGPAGGRGGTGLWAPVVHGLYLNAVEISQARTVENEILGSSLGEPGMTVELAEGPVLPDTVRLRVRERLSDEERAALEAEQRAAAGPGHGPLDPVVQSGLDRIPGSWVLWRRVDSLIGQGGDARVYVLDQSSGRVTFGDDRNGKIPPAGRDNIRAFSYQQGGGAAGNLPAWSTAKLTSAVEGVDTVVLPVESVGGFGAPAADSLFATAPHRLRHVGRAMTPADVEALAVASSADIVRAHCARPAGPREPMRVTIAVRDGSRCPRPTLAQRDGVAAFIREVGWGGLGDGSVEVREPAYLGVAVTVRLVAPRARLAGVERAAKEILVKLFDPANGGPDGSGWPFGRRPTSSDLLRALGDVDGLDRVDSIDLSPIGDRSLDQLPADGLVCAETTDITVVVTALEGAA